MSNQITDWQSGRNCTAANQYMFENKIGTDVKFVFMHKREDDDQFVTTYLEAHRYILVSRSPVFFTMFYGSFQESGNGIEITDIEHHIFEDMLRFMYTDKVSLTTGTALDVLYAANKYQITNLTKECKKFLINHMTKDNAVVILDNAIFYGHLSLKKKCINFMKDQVHQDIVCLNQHHVAKETLESILEEKEVVFSEKDLFEYCNEWAAKECKKKFLEPTGPNKRAVLGDVIFKLRIANMASRDIAAVVTPSELLTDDEELAIFRYINKAKDAKIPFVTGRRMHGFQMDNKSTLNGLHITVSSYCEWQFCGLVYGETDRDVQNHVTINDHDYVRVKIDSKHIVLPAEECRTLRDNTTALSMDISRANRIDIRIYKVGTMPHERIKCDNWLDHEHGPLRHYMFKEKKSFIEGVIFRRRILKKSKKGEKANSGDKLTADGKGDSESVPEEAAE